MKLLPSHLLIGLFTGALATALAVPLGLILIYPHKVGSRRYPGFVLLFTNHRSGGVPEDYEVDKPGWRRAVDWWLRNPAHDFTSYAIGFEGKVFETIKVVGPEEITLRSDIAQDGWIVAIRKRHGFPFPFVSYSKRRPDGLRQFYWGWRPHGAFGIKNRLVKREP